MLYFPKLALWQFRYPCMGLLSYVNEYSCVMSRGPGSRYNAVKPVFPIWLKQVMR